MANVKAEEVILEGVGCWVWAKKGKFIFIEGVI